MNTMGLDLALTETGYAVLHDGGVNTRGIIKTDKRGTDRIVFITDEVLRHVEHHAPTAIAIEAVAYNSSTAVMTAELHGSVRTMLWRAGYRELLHVAPATLKKFATGDGRAQKSDLKLELYKRWKIDERNDNKADAYVLSRMAAVHRGFLKPDTKEQMKSIKVARNTTDLKEGRIVKARKKKETANV